MKTTIIILMSCILIYAMFSEEIEIEPPVKAKPKKYIKVKRNGEWVDEED